jgi:hypothetical protein
VPGLAQRGGVVGTVWAHAVSSGAVVGPHVANNKCILKGSALYSLRCSTHPLLCTLLGQVDLPRELFPNQYSEISVKSRRWECEGVSDP